MTAMGTNEPSAPAHAHVEPTAGLQWSQALRLPTTADTARTPAEIRRALVHRASQDYVLSLYRDACSGREPAPDVPAPWWLRALAAGKLESRALAFRIEDRITQLLLPRPGWEYVPWVADGESGYWEFLPSERGPSGFAIPTTVLFTDRHPGWVDLLPAHNGQSPDPIAIGGVSDLRARLGKIEATR